MRWVAGAFLVVAAAAAIGAQPGTAPGEVPTSLAEFRARASRIVEEAGLPGAGIALVNTGGVEWAGGVGVADRETRRPVTADTLFRVGSISKSFVALALVQLYEDGAVDLDATVESIVPDVHIDNPWQAVEPVRVRHLLEHTAGFDDMHFNEVYVLDDAPDLPLEEVLRRNPASRRVRWRPGTRMAYSNPGYAVAGRIVEAVSGKRFDQFILERIFAPLEMKSSTFVGDPSAPALAQGYDSRSGRPVVRRRIHLRPAGALHSTPRELGHFVQMLLNWGERGESYVVDPEYLSNMEWPRTTAAATAGVRAGYGLGITSTIDLPFHVLGHQGGIDGFMSTYGYSPSRDVGYVVLLNGSHAPEALRRLSALALAYLKRDVAPTAPETLPDQPRGLDRFEGYYHEANPRSALMEALMFPAGGLDVSVRDGRLVMAPTIGAPVPLVAVNDGLFRRDGELTASLAFTTVAGTPVLTGARTYAERRARWPIDALRVALAAALAVVVLAPLGALVAVWRDRGTDGGLWRALGLLWTLAVVVLASTTWAAFTAPPADLAVLTLRSGAILSGTAIYPILAATLLPVTAWVWARGRRGGPGLAAAVVAAAHAGLASYAWWWGLVGLSTWTY